MSSPEFCGEKKLEHFEISENVQTILEKKVFSSSFTHEKKKILIFFFIWEKKKNLFEKKIKKFLCFWEIMYYKYFYILGILCEKKCPQNVHVEKKIMFIHVSSWNLRENISWY